MKPTLYLVFWNNGWSYEDEQDIFVGVFSSEAKACRAGRRFHKMMTTGDMPVCMGYSSVKGWRVEEALLDHSRNVLA